MILFNAWLGVLSLVAGVGMVAKARQEASAVEAWIASGEDTHFEERRELKAYHWNDPHVVRRWGVVKILAGVGLLAFAAVDFVQANG